LDGYREHWEATYRRLDALLTELKSQEKARSRR